MVGVARPDGRDGRLVVVHAGDPAGDTGQQVGPVALAEPGFQHVTPGAPVGQALVDDLVPAEPVVLDVQARNRALAGQRQRQIPLGGTPRGGPLVGGTVGNECAHCKAG